MNYIVTVVKTDYDLLEDEIYYYEVSTDDAYDESQEFDDSEYEKDPNNERLVQALLERSLKELKKEEE